MTTQEKFLWIIRHAKSARPFGVDDMQRPLIARGERDGVVMAKQLANAEHPPEKLLVSNALRTTRTADLVNAELQVDIELVPELYSANSSDVESLMWSMDEALCSVAIVTHLPTIERCLWASKNRKQIDLFPTLGMACLEYIGCWHSFNFRSTEVRDFMIPRSFR